MIHPPCTTPHTSKVRSGTEPVPGRYQGLWIGKLPGCPSVQGPELPLQGGNPPWRRWVRPPRQDPATAPSMAGWRMHVAPVRGRAGGGCCVRHREHATLSCAYRREASGVLERHDYGSAALRVAALSCTCKQQIRKLIFEGHTRTHAFENILEQRQNVYLRSS